MTTTIRGMSTIRPGVESHLDDLNRFVIPETAAGVESMPEPGLEGIGDIISSIGRGLNRLFNNTTLEQPDGLVNKDTKDLIDRTIRSPKWRALQNFRTGTIPPDNFTAGLCLGNKNKTSDILSNIADSTTRLKTEVVKYARVIDTHSDAVFKINKELKGAWFATKDDTAKLDLLEKAIKDIQALPTPQAYYTTIPGTYVGDRVATVHNNVCGWTTADRVPKAVPMEFLAKENFDAFCEAFLQLFDEFTSPTSMFDTIYDVCTYVEFRNDYSLLKDIERVTNEGSMFHRYAVACDAHRNQVKMVYSSIFSAHYQKTIRCMLQFIKYSVS